MKNTSYRDFEHGAGYGKEPTGWAKGANYCINCWTKFTALTESESKVIKEWERGHKYYDDI